MNHLLRIALGIVIAIFVSGCFGKKHKVNFEAKIYNDGEKPFKMECFAPAEVKDFMIKQNDAFMKGTTPPPQPKALASYDSKTKPETDTKFTLEMPEKDTICLVDVMKSINLHTKEKSGEVFKPKDGANIRFHYNMYNKKFYKLDQPSENIEIVDFK